MLPSESPFKREAEMQDDALEAARKRMLGAIDVDKLREAHHGREHLPESTYEDRQRQAREANLEKFATRDELETINYLLGEALQSLGSGDKQGTENAIEEARGMVYRHLR